MSSIHVQSGQTLPLVIDNAQSFKRRCPEQFDAFVECAALVSWRIVVAGAPPLQALSFIVQALAHINRQGAINDCDKVKVGRPDRQQSAEAV
jgi:hypothetical protein